MESTREHECDIAVGSAPTVAMVNLPSLPLQLKGEVWSRVGSPTEIQMQLKARLEAKHQQVEKFCDVHRPQESISYVTFRKFMNGERGDKPLNSVHFELLNAFCDHCFLPSNEDA